MNSSNREPESRLYISEQTIIRVIAAAAESVSGVACVKKKSFGAIRRLVCGGSQEMIKLRPDGDVLFVAAAIVLEPHAAALETAQRVQQRIKSAVQNRLGITVAKVNVTVSDAAEV